MYVPNISREMPGYKANAIYTHTHTHTPKHTLTHIDKGGDLSHAERSDIDAGAIGGGGVKGDSSPSLSSTHSRKEQLPFFSGIPSVEVVKGLLHLYKPQSVTRTSY